MKTTRAVIVKTFDHSKHENREGRKKKYFILNFKLFRSNKKVTIRNRKKTIVFDQIS